MKNLLLTLLILVSSSSLASNNDQTLQVTQSLTREILVNGQAYSNLSELVAGGSRLSGSAGAAKAVEWAKNKLQSYDLDKVWLQPVMVPHWERGNHEEAIITSGGRGRLRVAALGNSVGTSPKGIEAEVIEVGSIEEAASLGQTLKGKIVFYNGKMDPSLIDTFDAYSQAVVQRTKGATQGAKGGAVAVLVRSLTLNHDHHPHTGVMNYKGAPYKIPATTIATADADRLSSLLKKSKQIRVRLILSAKPLSPVESFNVIGELTGREIPDQYMVVGGHLDSWDLGPGAQDDGAGVVQSIEVVRAMKALNIQPRRSLRVVLFMSEEFGGIGGIEYAKQVALKKENHIAALESDRGGFTPRGFETTGDEKFIKKISSWSPFLAPLGADLFKKGEGGTDIEPLMDLGAAQFGLFPDSARYFDYHHAETDTMDAVNPRELHMGAAAMAVLSYLITDQGL